MIHEKKTWPNMFESVLSGKKKFDVRLQDAEYKEGDTLLLREWSPQAKQYTGRVLHKKITFVLNTKQMPYWSGDDVKEYGLSVLSLEDLNP
ncbi:MAG: DUF3850 domain-containing protein [Nanoarchaeota archaeon]